jgi:hypothetical protein
MREGGTARDAGKQEMQYEYACADFIRISSCSLISNSSPSCSVFFLPSFLLFYGFPSFLPPNDQNCLLQRHVRGCPCFFFSNLSI